MRMTHQGLNRRRFIKGPVVGLIVITLLTGAFTLLIEPAPAGATVAKCRISAVVTLPTEAELTAALTAVPGDAIEGTARSGWITVWAGTDARCRARLRKGAVFVREVTTLSIRLSSEPSDSEKMASGTNLFWSGQLGTWPENLHLKGWSFGNGDGFSWDASDPAGYRRYRDFANAGAGYVQQLGGRGVTEAYLHSEDCFPAACTFQYEFIGFAGDVNGNLDYGYQVTFPLCGGFDEVDAPGTVQCYAGSDPEKAYPPTYALKPFLGARIQIEGQLTYEVVAEYR